ncbi:Synaptobrevin [Geodia barretti]|uniref:Synaptobrevin n=1 Tax=Geodia barretti TaxID=519541 RepID=A0AA35S819_GEOBA|nr:Synaptobrevin [Geodia barretti]
MEEDDPRISLLKKQTTQVTETARENVRKVVARGDNIDDLQQRAESLQQSAHHFDINATRLRRKMCWQSISLWILLLIVLVIILLTLIVSIAVVVEKNKKKN